MAEGIYGFQDEYRFLSNFDPTPVVYMGFEFKTAEHLYNAMKTDSLPEALYVMDAPTPGQAKNRGRSVTLRANWQSTERFSAMRATLGAKFIGNRELAQKLVATGDAPLTEANKWHDQTWGDCYCGQPRCAEDGENHLGKMLMELRDDLRRWM
jgi:ribA/ribD-fused uncharacterized protein